MDRIIFKIPEDLKKEFKDTCKVLGMDMTSVLISKIIEFTEKSKEQPKR